MPTETSNVPSPSVADNSSAAPSRIRYWVVAAAIAMSIVLYLDRFCVSTSERYIKEDLGLTERQMAHFIKSFFWAYALAQVPSGWFGDKWGIRSILAFYILVWSLFTGFMGAATGAFFLLAMRFGCGLAQAGAYPVSGSLLRRWIPAKNRGLASGLVALGGRVGAVIAPVLTASLMVAFVPLSTDVSLSGQQILNPFKLATELSKSELPSSPDSPSLPNPLTPKGHIWALLSDADRDLVRNLAVNDPEMASTPESADRTAQVLNRLLDNESLFDLKAMDRLSLSEEALKFAKRVEKGEELDLAVRRRFHRLILEAVFRDEVGKLYVRGWRPVLYVYGIAGVGVALVFWLVFRDRPADHPFCNLAEQRLIAGISATEDATVPLPASTPPPPSEALPFVAIVRSPDLWLSSFLQFGTNIAWLFLLTYLPRYLLEVHDVPILTRSVMVSIPPMAGIAGMFLGGILTDQLTRRFGLKRGRAWPMGFTRFCIAGAYLGCMWSTSPWQVVFFASMAFFFVDLGVSAVWAHMQDVGKSQVASILGWANMWGNIGAAVAPDLYYMILGENAKPEDWSRTFLFCAGCTAVAGIAGLLIDATRPVFRDLPNPAKA